MQTEHKYHARLTAMVLLDEVFTREWRQWNVGNVAVHSEQVAHAQKYDLLDELATACDYDAYRIATLASHDWEMLEYFRGRLISSHSV